MSLRRRMFVALMALAAVVVVTNVVISNIFESVLLDRVDQQLVQVASQPIFGGAKGGPDDHHEDRPLPSDDSQTLSEYFIATASNDASTFTTLSSAFVDSSEAPPRVDADQIRAHVAADEGKAASSPFTVTATSGNGRWRLVAINDPRRGVTIVGLSLREVADTVRRIRYVQLGGIVGLFGGLGLVSWWVLRLGVHPIEDMAKSADAIATGDLSQRVEHPGPRTEAGRLGIALNSMLGRIEEAFRAQEASEARVRRFAADASHELRTPLTSIRGYAELWRAGGLRKKEDLAEAMRRMEQEASRMGTLVEDLLLLARLDQRRPLDRGAVRLDELAADAVRDARAVEPNRPIELTTDLVVVDGDELRLRQVVANLMGNVQTHTPPDAAVRVSVSALDGRARLEVADDGPGMSPETAAKVFERFYRADSSRHRSAGGTGLGLSIVAAIAEAHGGWATVNSSEGAGTTFVVELPQN